MDTHTGMAASSVPIRREVPDLREELTQAGVRFVYFSSRNMRRSKPVAEKIGLQFDWNVRAAVHLFISLIFFRRKFDFPMKMI